MGIRISIFFVLMVSFSFSQNETEKKSNNLVFDGNIKFDNKDFEILAIVIGHDVSRYYKKDIKITEVQELGDVMIKQLSQLFDNKTKKKTYH